MKYRVLFHLLLAVLLVPAVFSCQSYRASQDSYVFKRDVYRPLEHESTVAKEELAEETIEAQAVSDIVVEENNTVDVPVSAEVSIEVWPASQTADKKIGDGQSAPRFVQDIAEGSRSREEAVEEYKNLSNREKKEVKRWLKKKVRDFKESAASPKQVEETDAVTRDTRTGIILGAAGLVLLLIGGGGVVGAIGAILFVVGLVFILLEVL
ncbi:MAG: hypothetical protein WBB45_19965 [Cyclobacteriaceae bacterium]